jgi:shikimate dehydrogenase
MTEAKRAACVVGWPVEHSRSPLIHNYWIKQLGLDAEYRREPVKPEQLVEFIGGLRQRGYAGCNITLPHKQAVLALTKPDDRARSVGAANTLWFDGDTLRSTNTDVLGFLSNLDESAPGWDSGLDTAVVLGAGGAARGILFALLSRGVKHIYLVNRTIARAEALAKEFGERVHPTSWAEVPKLLGNAGLLVNTTSLGMTGQPPLEIELRGPPSMVVTDIVYNPLETGLLAQAHQRKLRTADGLGMLLHQAVYGFELWFGVRPKVTPELRALAVADLTR